MLAQAKEGATRVVNPAPGTVLAVPAGAQAEALFDFVNDAPFVANFHLEVEGLPGPEWASGVGPEAKMAAAASGGGTLRLVLSPPADAALRDYALQTSVVSEGVMMGEGPVSLILRVEPGAAPPAAPEPVTLAERSQPAEHPQPAEHSQPAERVSPKAETAADRPFDGASAAPRTAPVPPIRTPESQAAPRAEAQPTTARPRTPAPAEEELELVDLPEPEETPEAPVDASNVLDPSDGSTLSLRPGETLLVRFGFSNDTRNERVFLIEEDRSLDSTWINIIQAQMHLMPNARGELSVRLSPPLGAEPGDYPFQIRVGPSGGVLTPCNLILRVLATPAVRLKATDRVVAGPFARAVDFPLSVERAGNADTAFRVAVKAPRVGKEEAGEEEPRGPDDLYETPQWRYLFDREMASLESPTHGRAPKPEPIRLRLLRKGIWWLGFRESHQIHVAAVPVTDPANGGKPGNTADLTAVRWRLLPVPGFVMAPLALLVLLLLGGAASDLRVVNPTYEAPDGVNYVVAVPQNETVKARLTWSAPWYALLRLTGGGESEGFVRPPQQIRAAFSGTGQRSVQREYRVSSLLGGGPSVKVRFVRARTDTPLEISGAQLLEDGSYRLTVPGGGIGRVMLRNRAVRDNRINFWVAKNPGNAFQVLDKLDEGSLDPVALGGQPRQIKVRAGANAAGGTDELVFVTTDSSHPVLVVKLISPAKD